MIRERITDELKINTNMQIFPAISDRGFWDEVKEFIIANYTCEFENNIENAKKPLTASLYYRFFEDGNRRAYEDIYFARRAALVAATILECVYNDGCYLKDILDLTWLILEETTWAIPAHQSFMALSKQPLPDVDDNTIDLFQADTAQQLAFVYQVMKERLDEFTPSVCNRIKARVNRDVLDDFINREDYHWMGYGGEVLNNWTPWIISNILGSATVLEDDPNKMQTIVKKASLVLDRYADMIAEDGACDEGPGYWQMAGLLFIDDIRWLNKITNNGIGLYDNPKAQNMLKFFERAHMGGGKFVNFADSGHSITGRLGTVYILAKEFGSTSTVNFARYIYSLQGDMAIAYATSTKPPQILDALIAYKELTKEPALTTIDEGEFFFDSTSLLVCSSVNRLSMSYKGGHNGESHNHNDIGSYTVNKNGKIFIADPGNLVYARETFSDKRYSIWNTRSFNHNVPFINGVEQQAGVEFKATNVEFINNGTIKMSMNLENAYPDNAGVKTWRRSLCYDKENQKISICDEFSLSHNDSLSLTFMTPVKPSFDGNKIVLVHKNGESVIIEFATQNVNFEFNQIESDDAVFKQNWDEFYHIDAKITDKSLQGKIEYIIY